MHDILTTMSSEIKGESRLIKSFISNAQDGDCVRLNVFPEIIKHFKKEMEGKDRLFFFRNDKGEVEPFNVTIYPELEREYPLRVSKLGDCSKSCFLEWYDINNDMILPKNDNYTPSYTSSARIGNFIHEIEQRYLLKMSIVNILNGKIQLEPTVKSEDLMIKGHIDYISNFKHIYNIDCDYVGELKTTGYTSREYYKDGELKRFHQSKLDKVITSEEPLSQHLYQANMYMYLKDMQFVLFHYICRGSNDVVCILYKREEELVEELIEKCKNVKEHLKKKTLPRVYHKELNKKNQKERCMFCRYTEICSNVTTIGDLNEYKL